MAELQTFSLLPGQVHRRPDRIGSAESILAFPVTFAPSEGAVYRLIRDFALLVLRRNIVHCSHRRSRMRGAFTPTSPLIEHVCYF